MTIKTVFGKKRIINRIKPRNPSQNGHYPGEVHTELQDLTVHFRGIKNKWEQQQVLNYKKYFPRNPEQIIIEEDEDMNTIIDELTMGHQEDKQEDSATKSEEVRNEKDSTKDGSQTATKTRFQNQDLFQQTQKEKVPTMQEETQSKKPQEMQSKKLQDMKLKKSQDTQSKKHKRRNESAKFLESKPKKDSFQIGTTFHCHRHRSVSKMLRNDCKNQQNFTPERKMPKKQEAKVKKVMPTKDADKGFAFHPPSMNYQSKAKQRVLEDVQQFFTQDKDDVVIARKTTASHDHSRPVPRHGQRAKPERSQRLPDRLQKTAMFSRRHNRSYTLKSITCI